MICIIHESFIVILYPSLPWPGDLLLEALGLFCGGSAGLVTESDEATRRLPAFRPCGLAALSFSPVLPKSAKVPQNCVLPFTYSIYSHRT